MKTTIKSETLKQYMHKLKEAEFDVYYPEGENPTYCFFVKDNNIGYVEYGDYGFNFSSVHKPNYKCGTGYSIFRNKDAATIADAWACFVTKPLWADIKDAPIKYKNWNEYESSPVNQIIKTVKF